MLVLNRFSQVNLINTKIRINTHLKVIAIFATRLNHPQKWKITEQYAKFYFKRFNCFNQHLTFDVFEVKWGFLGIQIFNLGITFE